MTVFLAVIIAVCIMIKIIKNEKKEQKALEDAKVVETRMQHSAICEINSGNLPIIKVDNLNYLPNERCHYLENAAYSTTTSSTEYHKFYNGTYTKGKQGGYRSGISTTYPVSTYKENIYKGTLIVTNERIIFINDKYSLCIPLCCVISFTPDTNKIDIYSGNRIDSIYVPNGFTVYNLLNTICKERNK